MWRLFQLRPVVTPNDEPEVNTKATSPGEFWTTASSTWRRRFEGRVTSQCGFFNISFPNAIICALTHNGIGAFRSGAFRAKILNFGSLKFKLPGTNEKVRG
jgi:hypothetical protein